MGRTNQSVSRLKALVILLLAIGVSSQANHVVADQPAPTKREQAIAHYQQGEAHFKAGSFELAVVEYEKAYALEAQPGLLFNIALAYESGGTSDKAIEYYDRYLAAEPGGARANEATARGKALKRTRDEANALEAKIAEHRRAADALLAEGKQAEAITELRALHGVQGKPQVIFEIARAYEASGERELARREYQRYLETNNPDHAVDAAARRRALEPVVVQPPKSGGEDEYEPRRFPIAPVAASGATAVFLGVALVFGAKASSLETELTDQIESRNPPVDNSDPRFDDGKSAATTANVLFLVSGVGVGVSGFLWWRYISKRKRRKSESATYIAPTQTGIAIGGNF